MTGYFFRYYYRPMSATWTVWTRYRTLADTDTDFGGEGVELFVFKISRPRRVEHTSLGGRGGYVYLRTRATAIRILFLVIK